MKAKEEEVAKKRAERLAKEQAEKEAAEKEAQERAARESTAGLEERLKAEEERKNVEYTSDRLIAAQKQANSSVKSDVKEHPIYALREDFDPTLTDKDYGYIWFVRFTCDMNECYGFSVPGSSNFGGDVIYGRRGDVEKLTMYAPTAKPGYEFEKWEKSSYTLENITMVSYRAVYKQI